MGSMYRVLLLVSTLSVALSSEWGYTGVYGGPNWQYLPGMEECGFNRQSPIDIRSDDVQLLEYMYTDFHDLHLEHYSVNPKNITIINDGRSVDLTIAGKHPSITGGGLHGLFRFHHLHFHWGSDSRVGSEHTIDGRSYPLEMHMVHYNAKYRNLGEAVRSGASDALAVIGVLFHLGEHNRAFEPITNALFKVRQKNAKYTLSTVFPLGSLLPSDTDTFYRYSGSLTTPPCNQVVVWTVLEETIPISESQLQAFRAVYDGRSHHMVDNYRPVQPLNRREVWLKSKIWFRNRIGYNAERNAALRYQMALRSLYG